MSLIQDLAATNDVAMNVAGAIERTLGDEIILAVGLPREEPPTADVLPPGNLRAARATFVEGIGGRGILFLGEQLTQAIEARGDFLSLIAPAIAAGAEEVMRASEGAQAGEPVE